MEKIQITAEQKQFLLKGFKKMKGAGTGFISFGAAATVSSIIVNLITDNVFFMSGAGFMGFLAMGVIFKVQAEAAMKKINQDDFQTFKTTCIRKRFFNEYAVVENNEILSKRVRKPSKWIMFIGSSKSVKAGDEIGIFKYKYKSKEVFAFSLDASE